MQIGTPIAVVSDTSPGDCDGERYVFLDKGARNCVIILLFLLSFIY